MKENKVDPNDNPDSAQYMSIHSAPWLTKHIASILSLLALIFTFLLFFAIIYIPLENSKKDIAIYILGVLSTIITQVFAFYFGSSKDSEVKNRLIQSQLSKNNKQKI